MCVPPKDRENHNTVITRQASRRREWQADQTRQTQPLEDLLSGPPASGLMVGWTPLPPCVATYFTVIFGSENYNKTKKATYRFVQIIAGPVPKSGPTDTGHGLDLPQAVHYIWRDAGMIHGNDGWTNGMSYNASLTNF